MSRFKPRALAQHSIDDILRDGFKFACMPSQLDATVHDTCIYISGVMVNSTKFMHLLRPDAEEEEAPSQRTHKREYTTYMDGAQKWHTKAWMLLVRMIVHNLHGIEPWTELYAFC